MNVKIVAVLAALCAGGAFAVDWFDAGISSYADWPTDGSDRLVEGQGTWTGTDNAVLADAHLSVDAMAKDNYLAFGPAVQKSAAEETLVYSLVTRFTVCECYPDLDAFSKCGLSVFTREDESETNYCGVVKNPDGAGNVWTTLSGATPVTDRDVAVTITMKSEDGVSKVRYKVGETVLTSGGAEWLEIADVSDMSGELAFGGTGSVASLSAISESAAVLYTLAIPALEHVTVRHVKVAGVAVEPNADGAYRIAKGSVVTVTFAPDPGWALDVASMTFVIHDDMTLPEAGRPRTIDVAAAITINEVMAKNGDTLLTETGFAGLDWVELYNSGDDAVDLTGWYFGNDPTKKASKWSAIAGSCVVPAKGYRILWCDGDGLCPNWAADEAHVAVNVSTDAGKHTLFLASTNKTSAISQQITLPGGVKDISWGRGHLSRTLVSSTSPARYKVGGGDWTSVSGPVGMSAATSGFTAVSHAVTNSLGNLDTAEACLLDSGCWKNVYTNTVTTIAFLDPNSTTGSFASDLYTGFPGARGNNVIYVITGTVMIPTSGDWSFAVGSDDGFSAKLTRLDRSWSWESRGTRGYQQSVANFNLEAGAYEVELRYFNAGGGYGLDFSAAKGRLSFDASKFRLVGAGDIVHAGALGAEVAADVSAEMVGKSKSLDWKSAFTLDDAPDANDAFRLNVKYADGFAAKLNGTVVASVAATSARPAAEALRAQTFAIPTDLVRKGTNTLEITAENDAIGDTEFYLSAEVVRDLANDLYVYFETPTPGAANTVSGRTGFTPKVSFSEPHGWKTGAFDLALSCPDNATAVICYTLDGTSPAIGAEGTYLYREPLHIDRTTVVRAAVPDVDAILQADASATYLFYDDVIRQGATPPAGFPADGAVNGQKLLYGMATAITEGDDDTKARLRRGFTENTRTMSLVIDPKNLFDGATGIYMNATGNGRGWERQTMAEQIDPMDATGADDFSVSAGLRIRGAYSRSDSHAKHSFRLFFRSEYGMGSLDHPLFGDEGTDSFEKIDLRTSQNYSWAENNDGDTFIHETFSRDSEGAMGKTYNRSRYYNLFINGVYWGLYQTEERVDQNYCESYNGGVADNYDVVRTSQPGYNTGVVEGESDAWSQLWSIAMEEGFGGEHSNNYNRVLGLNPDGTRNPDCPILLNVTNLIEYVLVTHYTEDNDCPVTSGGSANNLIAFRSRIDGRGKEDGFLWNRHDAEHSLGYAGGAKSLNSLVYGTDEYGESAGANGRKLGNFNPNVLNYALMTNAIYRQTFSDLVYKHMVRTGGALTAPVAEARFRARMAELDDVIVCESARWGYQFAGRSRNRALWLQKCANCISFINNRLTYLIPEYQRRGWYTPVVAPSVVDGADVTVTNGMTIAAPAEGLRLAEVMSSAPTGDDGDYLVLTNIAPHGISLAGVKLVAWNAKKKSEATPSLTLDFAEGAFLSSGASLTVAYPDFGGGKLTDSQVGIRIYDASSTLVQDAFVDADWWSGICDGQGGSFIATAFGAEVKTTDDWKPSIDPKPSDWPDDPDTEITEATTPADLGIAEGAFTNSTTAELRKLAKWAKAASVPFGDGAIKAMDFDAKGNPLNTASEAYLLNCTIDEVEAEKAAFKFPSITPGTTPSIDGSGYNGNVNVFGRETLGGAFDTAPDEKSRFYKATLTR